MAEPRMTMTTLKVLGVLLDDPTAEHYGLEIAKAAGLASGSLYPILARLEQAGWIQGSWEDVDPVAAGRRPRRYYRLTPHGVECARQAREDAQRALWPTLYPQPSPSGQAIG
jgi:PadR family transcriptional regulator PadR